MRNGLGAFPKVLLPSGEMVTLSPEEETALAKEIIREKIKADKLRYTRIESSAIEAAGTAAGMAIGGLLIGLILGKVI